MVNQDEVCVKTPYGNLMEKPLSTVNGDEC